MPKGIPKVKEVKKYAPGPTDFNQVETFNHLFANLVERSRGLSIPEMLDYLLSEGGVEMDNQMFMLRLNKLGMRTELRTPRVDEDKEATV